MITSSKPKPSRNRVDMSTTHTARQWRKRLNKSAEEIEAAVAKVGDNAEGSKSSETTLLGPFLRSHWGFATSLLYSPRN
jgi:hypothetical protein